MNAIHTQRKKRSREAGASGNSGGNQRQVAARTSPGSGSVVINISRLTVLAVRDLMREYASMGWVITVVNHSPETMHLICEHPSTTNDPRLPRVA